MSDGEPSVKQPARIGRPPGPRTNYAELKRRRVEAGLSLRALAGEVGSTAPNLSQIERGAYNAGSDLLHRLAAVLGCDVTDLIAKNGTHN